MRPQLSSAAARCVLLYLALMLSIFPPLRLPAAQAQTPGASTPAPANAVDHGVDPDKPASEMNHHIAGAFLIAIGLSVIWSERRGSLHWLRWLPPVLFIAAGIFLAAWSDDEIWPRGGLSWLWLLHHDAEARQHKLYALLLIVLGAVECVRALPTLRRRWLSVVFPILCVIGGGSLFFHHHEGLADGTSTVTAAAPLPQPAQKQRGPGAPAPAENSHHHEPEATPPGHDHNPAGFLPSSTRAASPQANSASPATPPSSAGPQQHHHGMNVHMANVQRQHAWFAVVGLCVALFKLLHDAARPPARVRQHLWANSVIVLGVLLLLYTE